MRTTRFCFTYVFLAFFLLVYSNALAQKIYNGNLTLKTQIAVDFAGSYSNYNYVSGDIIIGKVGCDITDLSPLNSLDSIGGNIIIYSTKIVSLNGLNNLKKVGRNFAIDKNIYLNSLLALSSLESISGKITITDNIVLKNFCAIAPIAVTKSKANLFISGNKRDFSKSDFENGFCEYKIYSGDITFKTMPQLEQFYLDGYAEVDGDIRIARQNMANDITNLKNLKNLRKITGDLHVLWNSNLKTLDGLENLEQIGGQLHISDNASLLSIDALSNLSSLGSISIGDNDALVNFCALQNISQTIPSTSFYIGYNPFNPTQTDFLNNDCSRPWYMLDVLLETQSEIDSFGNLGYTYLGGSITINDKNRYINNLSNLSQIDSIGGNLSITNCKALSSLLGLESITKIKGNLSMNQCHKIENLTGLDNLQYLEGELNIIACSDMNSLTGLENVKVLNKLLLSSCQSLTSLSGLNNVTQINQSLAVLSCLSLPSLQELNSLKSVGKNFYLDRNISLESINLTNLINISGELYIQNNDSLESLNGFNNLKTTSAIYIGTNKSNKKSGNPMLFNYCALNLVLSQLSADKVHVKNNLYNPSFQNIMDGKCIQRRPIANAGYNISRMESLPVKLNGNESKDLDSDTLYYIWNTPIEIGLDDSTLIRPTFIAPRVENLTSYDIVLTVYDGYFYSSPDTIRVSIYPNDIPIAKCSNDTILSEYDTAYISGKNSFDPNKGELTYYWQAPSCFNLSDTTSQSISFTIPKVNKDSTFNILLFVHDGLDFSNADTLKISVLNNNIPIIKINKYIEAKEYEHISISADQSYDPEGNQLSFHWQVPSEIIVSDTLSEKISFTAPMVNKDTTFNILLFVHDGLDYSNTDTLKISVLNNLIPIIKVNKYIEANENENINISAEQSYDPEGNQLSFHWQVPSGIIVSDTLSEKISFTTPEVTKDSIIRLVLTINDDLENSLPEDISLMVHNLSYSPSAQENFNIINVKTWPNPAKEILFVESIDIIKAVSFIQLNGAILLNKQFNTQNQVQIDISNINQGLYIVIVETDKYTFREKVLKK